MFNIFSLEYICFTFFNILNTVWKLKKKRKIHNSSKTMSIFILCVCESICLCVSLSRQFLFYFLSCLLKLFLAVVPAHKLLTLRSSSLGSEILISLVGRVYLFPVVKLLLLSLHTFSDQGLQLAEIFQWTPPFVVKWAPLRPIIIKVWPIMHWWYHSWL